MTGHVQGRLNSEADFSPAAMTTKSDVQHHRQDDCRTLFCLSLSRFTGPSDLQHIQIRIRKASWEVWLFDQGHCQSSVQAPWSSWMKQYCHRNLCKVHIIGPNWTINQSFHLMQLNFNYLHFQEQKQKLKQHMVRSMLRFISLVLNLLIIL